MRHPVISGCLAAAFAVATAQADDRDDRGVRTATPVKHLVVIFQENISYDHYFGTYPNAPQNIQGETPFKASKRTPINNNLLTPLDVNRGFRPLTGVEPPHQQSERQLQRSRRSQQRQAERHRRGKSVPSRPLGRPRRRIRDITRVPRRAPTTTEFLDGFPAWVGTAGGGGAAAGRGRHQGPGDGLFRRQHGHRHMELRQHFALNDNSYTEPVWSVNSGCAQPYIGPI